MAITVSLINMKGGVGKSTLTVNLAWHFAAYTPF
jgi:chromosome partitioning protein